MTRRRFGAATLGLPAVASRPAPSWLLATRNGVESAAYAEADREVSMGSLLKPFLALASLRSGRELPEVTCRGVEQGCWKPGGHGPLQLPAAIAYSCNVYFLALARQLDRAALDLVCLSCGLKRPEREWDAARLIGMGQGWPQTAREVSQAFLRLASGESDGSVRAVLNGMALCASRGTAQDVGFACYAKTGTARCAHVAGGSGDGYAVALYPLQGPRSALLVMQHGTTGATAARALRPAVRKSL